MAKKIKKEKIVGKALASLMSQRNLKKEAKVVAWYIGDAASATSLLRTKRLTHEEWEEAVEDILDEIRLHVIAAVADANDDTRLTLSRASRTNC